MSVPKHTALSVLLAIGLLFYLYHEISSALDGNKDDDKPKVDPEKKALDEKIDAWVIAQEFIKRELKSPGTADFGSAFRDYQDPEAHVTKRPDGSFFIHGWVDSQNSFGAIVRTKWNIQIRLNGDTWNIVSGPEFLN